jgi:hypothetical protein
VCFIHFMDDFICLSGGGKAVQLDAFRIMKRVMADLGVPLAEEKEKIAVQTGEFLGLILDTRNQIVDCPEDKRAAIVQTLLSLTNAATKCVQVKTLETLLGRLTWLHLVWPHSRPWVNPWLRCVAKHTQMYFHPRITEDMRESARHWLGTLKAAPPRPFQTRPGLLTARALCTGVSNSGRWWKDKRGTWRCTVDADARVDWWRDGPSLLNSAVYCGDAAGEEGWGWFSGAQVQCGMWSKQERASFTLNNATGESEHRAAKGGKVSSTLQEVRCMRFAVQHWATTNPAPGAIVTYFTDSDNAVHVMRKMRSNKEAINDEIKLVADLCRENGWQVRVVWHSRSCLAGRCADALSRGDVQEFRTLAPAHPCLRSRTPTSTRTTGSLER